MSRQLLEAFGHKMKIINPYRFASGSGFLPTDISDLNLWLDAADRGSTALTWDDKSGNNYHYVAASSGEFPAFSGGIASFDYTANNHLDGPNHLSALTAGELFVRMRKNADPAANTISASGAWAFGSSNTTSGREHIPYTDGVVYCGWGSTVRKTCGNPTPSLTDWRTINAHSAASDWGFRIDNSALHTTTTNTVGFLAAPVIGHSTAGYSFDGDIKAVLIYSRKLTAGERSDVHTYLAAL